MEQVMESRTAEGVLWETRCDSDGSAPDVVEEMRNENV
jgi:hypothetical protein